MALDKAAVRNIARLARVRVPEDELDGLAVELSNILTFVEQLGEVDTAGIEPMTSVVAMTLPRRADAVTDGNIADMVLGNAPEGAGNFFTVPKVVE